MVAEDGSIKTANISVAPALKLYRKKLKIYAVIALIIGAIGLIAYIVVSTVLETKTGVAPRWVKAFLVFAVPFTLGLLGLITIVRLGKRESQEMRTSECVFYADCFFYRSKSAFQSEICDKFCYSDAVLKRENEKYGYIFIIDKGWFSVFGKDGLEEKEINTIRKLFGQAEVAETVEIKNYKPDEDK